MGDCWARLTKETSLADSDMCGEANSDVDISATQPMQRRQAAGRWTYEAKLPQEGKVLDLSERTCQTEMPDVQEN